MVNLLTTQTLRSAILGLRENCPYRNWNFHENRPDSFSYFDLIVRATEFLSLFLHTAATNVIYIFFLQLLICDSFVGIAFVLFLFFFPHLGCSGPRRNEGKFFFFQFLVDRTSDDPCNTWNLKTLRVGLFSLFIHFVCESNISQFD